MESPKRKKTPAKPRKTAPFYDPLHSSILMKPVGPGPMIKLEPSHPFDPSNAIFVGTIMDDDDDGGTKLVEYRLNAGPWLPVAPADPGTGMFDLSLGALPKGTHKVIVRATSAKGRKTRTTHEVVVD